MEVIRIPGYTEDEKINIANKFLLPKQIKNNGVKDGEFELLDGTIKEVIRNYTRESGVRNLEREISKITRKVVKKVVNNEEKKVKINQGFLEIDFDDGVNFRLPIDRIASEFSNKDTVIKSIPKIKWDSTLKNIKILEVFLWNY